MYTYMYMYICTHCYYCTCTMYMYIHDIVLCTCTLYMHVHCTCTIYIVHVCLCINAYHGPRWKLRPCFLRHPAAPDPPCPPGLLQDCHTAHCLPSGPLMTSHLNTTTWRKTQHTCIHMSTYMCTRTCTVYRHTPQYVYNSPVLGNGRMSVCRATVTSYKYMHVLDAKHHGESLRKRIAL